MFHSPHINSDAPTPLEVVPKQLPSFACKALDPPHTEGVTYDDR